MKFLFLLSTILFMASCARTINDTDLVIGKGADENINITFDKGGSNPVLRYDASDGKVKFSNDGTTFKQIGSGSGSGGFNSIVTDGGFEQEEAVGICTNCTLEYGTTNVYNPSATQTKYGSITFGSSTTGDYTDTYSISSEFANGDAFFYAVIRTTRADVNLELYSNSNLKYSVPVNNDGNWHVYEIPFVAESTNIAFKIDATSASTTAIDIDNIIFGALPVGYIGNISQAQFVGSLVYATTNCLWQKTTTASVLSDFAVDADCTASNIEGGVDEPDTRIPGIKILNARTDGYYRVSFAGLYGDSGANTCRGALSSTGSFDSQGDVYTSTNSNFVNNIEGSFKFTTSGDKTVRVIGYLQIGTSCSIYARGTSTGEDGERVKFTVHFFPDNSNKIVKQSTQLDASTSNNFNAKVSSTDVVSDEDFDFINGDCTDAAAGRAVCNFVSGIFTVSPICHVTAINNVVEAYIVSTSTSSVDVRTRLSDGTPTNGPFNISCSRAGSDVVKGIELAGVFNDTNIKKVADVYSSTEVEWGTWDGSQLYRRCFTVGSDITTNGLVTTWSANLNPKRVLNHSGTEWVLISNTQSGSSTDQAAITYNRSTGVVFAYVTGWKIGAGTSLCMEYTR